MYKKVINLATISVSATKSITISSKYPDKSFLGKEIVIGTRQKHRYYSFLFFDTSFVPADTILSATLVLFKVADFVFKPQVKFCIEPLLDPFSSYTTYKKLAITSVDKSSAIEFSPLIMNVGVKIDITSIVNRWLNHTLPNYGLLLSGSSINPRESRCTSFGSAYHSDNTLIPYISINLLPPPINFTYTATVNESKSEASEHPNSNRLIDKIGLTRGIFHYFLG